MRDIAATDSKLNCYQLMHLRKFISSEMKAVEKGDRVLDQGDGMDVFILKFCMMVRVDKQIMCQCEA